MTKLVAMVRRAALAVACLAIGASLAACGPFKAPVPGLVAEPAAPARPSETPTSAQARSDALDTAVPAPVEDHSGAATESATPFPATARSAAASPAATPAGETPTPTETHTATASLTATPSVVPSTPTRDLPVAPRVGARAPEFLLPDLSGTQVSLNARRGELVLLNFWTTW